MFTSTNLLNCCCGQGRICPTHGDTTPDERAHYSPMITNSLLEHLNAALMRDARIIASIARSGGDPKADPAFARYCALSDAYEAEKRYHLPAATLTVETQQREVPEVQTGKLMGANDTEWPVKNKEYYKPIENPRMYPLELNEDLHICLWDEKGEYKWTIAYWEKDKEGYDLKFVGDRPLNSRVNWGSLKSIIRQGQDIADKRFQEEEK